MNINTTKTSLAYIGNGSSLAILLLKNLLLVMVTFGFYYPWAKVDILKYHAQATTLNNEGFVFHGTGKEVFIGYLKVFLLFFIYFSLLALSALLQIPLLTMIVFFSFYLFFILLIPFALHGSIRYRSSRTSWKSIHFRYVADKITFVKLFFKGFILTIITFGVYGSWFEVDLRKFIISNLKFGNVSYRYTADGTDLFFIKFKYFFIIIFTLGIGFFWYVRDLLKFHLDNLEISQDFKQSFVKTAVTPGEIFSLLIVNFLLLVFTFGLAFPWVIVRTNQFVFSKIQVEGEVDFNTTKQEEVDDYRDAASDSIFDFDLL